MRKTGMILIFIGGSMSGKTTIMQGLLHMGNFAYPLLKYTTRKIRKSVEPNCELLDEIINSGVTEAHVRVEDFYPIGRDDVIHVDEMPVPKRWQYEANGNISGIKPIDSGEEFEDMLDGASHSLCVNNFDIINTFKEDYGESVKVIYVKTTYEELERRIDLRMSEYMLDCEKKGIIANPKAFAKEYLERAKTMEKLEKDILAHFDVIDRTIITTKDERDGMMQALGLVYKFTKDEFSTSPKRPKDAPYFMLIGRDKALSIKLADRLHEMVKSQGGYAFSGEFDDIERFRKVYKNRLVPIYVFSEVNDRLGELYHRYYVEFGAKMVDGVIQDYSNEEKMEKQLKGVLAKYEKEQKPIVGYYDKDFEMASVGRDDLDNLVALDDFIKKYQSKSWADFVNIEEKVRNIKSGKIK